MMGGKLHGKWRLPTALSGCGFAAEKRDRSGYVLIGWLSGFAAEKRDPGYGSRRQHLRVLRRQGTQVADVDYG